ncbi:MAG: hypothetical protein A3F11_04935 [Gammaproteobacteria bacterium RIFCSPHIGHO2_12_FULL_37_14]|nr:MAG: hypothetical protein A3F11_04935 [Gammaproteobacteria bacterium RIFCSPHIGHO2_12_FULL_37_14]
MEIKNKVLMIYIEPTPYIIGLINAINVTNKDPVDILFLTENQSQDWNMSCYDHWMFLPAKWINRVRLIRKIFFSGQYNLIHVAGWSEIFCFISILFAKICHIPIVIETDTPHPPSIRWWKQAVKRLIYPAIFRMVDIFMPGGTRQSEYLEYYGVPSKKIVPAQMTVDVTYMQKCLTGYSIADRKNTRQQYRIPDDHIVFMYAGRLVSYKGIFDLIDAFKKLSQDNVTLLIAGDGELRQKIEEIVNHDKKIRYTGRLQDDALFKAYFASDVFVLPSHFEPWGLVVNEAMAMEKPVIVTDRVGCVDDLVEDGETGFVVKAGHPENLQTAMEWLIKNPKAVATMGKKAAQKISTWTLENEAKNICQAWAKTIKIKVFSHDLNS